MTILGNLDQLTFPVDFDPMDPRRTSRAAMSLSIADQLGRAVRLDAFFGKDAPVAGHHDDWTYHVLTDGANLATTGDGHTPAIRGTPTEVASGRLRFDAGGALLVHEPSTTLHFVPKGALDPQPLELIFGVRPAAGGGSWTGLTQYPSTTTFAYVAQDGTGAAIDCTTARITGAADIPDESGRGNPPTLPRAAARAGHPGVR